MINTYQYKKHISNDITIFIDIYTPTLLFLILTMICKFHVISLDILVIIRLKVIIFIL